MDGELMKLEKEIQHNGLDPQELLDERAQLRKKSTMVETGIKQLREEIKKKLLGKKLVVITQDELDYIDRLGTQYHNNPKDVRKCSSMKVVNGHLVGALKQNLMEDKLERRQVEP